MSFLAALLSYYLLPLLCPHSSRLDGWTATEWRLSAIFKSCLLRQQNLTNVVRNTLQSNGYVKRNIIVLAKSESTEKFLIKPTKLLFFFYFCKVYFKNNLTVLQKLRLYLRGVWLYRPHESQICKGFQMTCFNRIVQCMEHNTLYS